MNDFMNDFTLTVWPWAALGLALMAAGIWLANWYLDQPLTDTDRDNSAADVDLGRREGREPTLVGSGLDALVEDSEVAFLDDIWFLPAYGEEKTA